MADINEMKENATENPEKATAAPEKKREGKVSKWLNEHPRVKKGLKIIGGAAAVAVGAVVAKKILDKKEDDAAEKEEANNALAQEWYNKGLLDAHKDDPVPDAVDVEVEPVEEETV